MTDIDLDEHLETLSVAIKNPKKDELKELMKKFVVTYKEPPQNKEKN